jgi:hypothetical protein
MSRARRWSIPGSFATIGSLSPLKVAMWFRRGDRPSPASGDNVIRQGERVRLPLG